jgi:hypothetical protein
MLNEILEVLIKHIIKHTKVGSRESSKGGNVVNVGKYFFNLEIQIFRRMFYKSNNNQLNKLKRIT